MINPDANLKIGKNFGTHISLWNLFFKFHSPFFYYFKNFEFYLFSPFQSKNFLEWEGVVHFNKDVLKNVVCGKKSDFVYVNRKLFRKYYDNIWKRFYFDERMEDYFVKKQIKFERREGLQRLEDFDLFNN